MSTPPSGPSGLPRPELEALVVELVELDPTPRRAGELRSRFDCIFLRSTGFATLDRLLKRLHANKAELLMVLDHPVIPLHTNGSENDIRYQVTKRAVSCGTRSDAGRDCRDAFLGLGKTCRKLGVAFWDYLGARIGVAGRPTSSRWRKSSAAEVSQRDLGGCPGFCPDYVPVRPETLYPARMRMPLPSAPRRVPGPARAARDFQRRRVYAWEDREIVPHASSDIPFAQAQSVVNAIWTEMGLRHPPAVERLPRQARSRLADASRLSLRLPARVSGWCLLHELAHAMTSTHDGMSDNHGPTFMGVYVGLLERYLRLPRAALLASLAVSGIAVDAGARPVFIDP